MKVAVVDMKEFQQRSMAFQKLAEELREKYESLKEKLDREKEQIVELEEELRKQSMMLSLDAREDKQKKLEKKKRYFKYLQNEYTQQMKDAENEARRKVTEEVAKLVEGIGEKKGYLLILDKGTVGLIYADESIDITDEVIEAYDRAKH
jgi:outer membrane protein